MNPVLEKAMQAASAARLAAAAARRQQMAQIRTTIQMHAAQNLHRRQMTTEAIGRIRRNSAALRKQFRAGFGRPPGPAPAEEVPGDETLQARVLEILERYPRGIGARQIGNELGIDWRSVMTMMSGLVAGGVVDQIEQEFYRAGKASQRC